MSDLIGFLNSFNSKERFFLVRQALGGFQLSCAFRRDLGEAIDLKIPDGAFAAMDYHLDWLVAALHAFERGSADETFDNRQGLVEGNQEDVDLLVAFEDHGRYHLVLVETKATTGWDGDQMRSKADRLRQIFGPEGDRYREVEPHFCLLSPRRPQKLRTTEWPTWMSKGDGTYFWFKLGVDEQRKMVTRCDAAGHPSAQGTHFKITAR